MQPKAQSVKDDVCLTPTDVQEIEFITCDSGSRVEVNECSFHSQTLLYRKWSIHDQFNYVFTVVQ